MTVKGKVKWFNKKNGYGFIVPIDGNKEEDVFVHITTLQSCGITMLTDGQIVSFSMVEGRNGKMAAENVTLVEDADQDAVLTDDKMMASSQS